MARIEYQDGSGSLKVVEVPRTDKGCVIGRSPTCHIVLSSHSVSRNHGRILVDNDRYLFQDLGGVNGSLVNDRKVSGSVVLKDGDVIRFGEVRVTFRAGDPEPMPAPDAVPEDDASAPVAPAVDEVALLQAENASLRARLDTAITPPSASTDGPDPRDDTIRHLQGLLEDARRRVQDAESRATVSASALDGVHTKYSALREQAQHLQERLEAVRSEAQDREVEAADLRTRLSELTGRFEAAQARTAGTADEVSGLKIKLTERDREIERLRREVDTQAYDLKALGEENVRLESYCQTDTGRQQMLERKVRNLEAVIEENRNLIEELRRTVEEREVEIRRVRAGAGMADLEEDRRRLLDDFHKKSRDLDETRSRTAALSAELEAIQGERDQALERIRGLEEAARTRRSEREDVSDHPEYLARVREMESLTTRVDAAEADASQRQAAEDELRAERARLAEELAQAQRQVASLQARVESLLERPVTSVEAAPYPATAPSPEAEVAVVSLLDDLAVMQAELRGVQTALAALAGVELPQAATAALGGATPVEAAEGVGELLRILGDDAARLQAARAGHDAFGDPAE